MCFRCLLDMLTTQQPTRSVLMIKACITLYNLSIMYEPVDYDEVIQVLGALPGADEDDEISIDPRDNDPMRRRMIYQLALDNM